MKKLTPIGLVFIMSLFIMSCASRRDKCPKIGMVDYPVSSVEVCKP